jgi:catechol 2,3-dioxygenase-like lactoylglutathione lyase family enzyme
MPEQEKAMLQDAPLYAYIPAVDVARARRFYEGKLGFVPQQETNGGVVYGFGRGTACFLYPTPNAGTSQASQAFWSVEDVDREIVALQARGVVFETYDMPGEKSPAGAVIAGGAKAAWFKDSEGNILAIIQTL